MKRTTATLLLCLVAQPYARGAEPDSHSSAPPSVHGNTLSEAVRAEATRLALAPTPGRRVQSEEAPKNVDKRHWCRRHLVGCGALAGFTTGFLVGLMRPADDFDATGFALIFGGPIGAGIGAAAGGIIWAYTDPQQP
jgi:hypothetical protein